MNVLLIIPEQSGTIARLSYNIYKGLLKLNSTKVYVARLHDSKKDEFPFDNVFCFDENKWYNNKYISQIRRIFFLNKLKRDLRINISISTLMAANVLNVLSRKNDKTIGIFHADLKQFRQTRYFLYLLCRFSYKYICNRLDKAVAISKKTQIDMLNHSLSNVQLIYNIHDIKNIRSLSCEPFDSLNENLIFKDNVVLFVGYLYKIKGIERLIRAFSMARKKNDSLKLVFVGGDPERRMDQYLKLINQIGEEDNVFFWGEKNNPYKYMAKSTMVVSSSYDEGLPGVIIESLSLGIPVVATNSSIGVWEIMECDDKYNSNEHEVIETSFGFITPNTENDVYNIQCLSEGILRSLSKEYSGLKSFDISRFEESTIIYSLLSNLK